MRTGIILKAKHLKKFREDVTPAIDAARAAGKSFEIHEYTHDVGSTAYGSEAVAKLNLSPDEVFKTLVVMTDAGEMVVGIVPVSCQLSQKAMARAAGAKKTEMAEVTRVERVTGYVAGGVSPLGQKRQLRTFIHDSAEGLSQMYVSAGRRGLEISMSPQDLADLVPALFAPIAQ